VAASKWTELAKIEPERMKLLALEVGLCERLECYTDSPGSGDDHAGGTDCKSRD
jgi:hypothetical protein